MRKMIAVVAVLSAMLVAGVANAQKVCMDNSQIALTVNVSNTNWNSDGDTRLGASVYSLDKVSNFGRFINASVFDDTYEVNYGVTKHIEDGLFGYVGLGFTSPMDHECPLVGTVTYGLVWDTNRSNLVFTFGEDTTAGHTLGVGTKF
jgi:hypothetical protein